ncbi:MAG: circularly permuted type 2 ATP-grasp protein [Hyphomicrobiaceae bacterium]|nr:circularly permuted type 2 ATP-grasp protein [Hyphomicrobiaceae bacterium]
MSIDAELKAPERDALMAGYRSAAAGHDELLDDAGNLKPHWAAFVDGLSQLSQRDRLARIARLDREVRETGLAHDIFADPDASTQQWRLNLAPLIISSGEWAWLEQAIAQRARLFNLILSDIYGPQDLLRSNRIPPECIFRDPAYLRQCQGITPTAGHLQFYAADLARGADGRWRVIDNHAETPAGLGYVVANRMMHTDVADEIFSECRARRLSWHFLDVQQSIADRTRRPDPSIAVLTPGPGHEDYFSHAYLARYLDLQLVEGGDLRVVGNELFLKTLEGLKRVDALVRCAEAARSDPLELDPSGFLGPSGLVHATRETPDLVLNALGAAIIENRALGSLLPGLCQELLGEPLMLQDAPRWWLGDSGQVAEASGRLDDIVIRPTREGTGRPGRASRGITPARMSAQERDALMGEIAQRGAELVAEQRLGFGTMPALTAQGLVPRAFAVRLYASAVGDSFKVLPGGLAMDVDPTSTVSLSTQSGDTHDVWVVSESVEEPHSSLWRPRIETALVQRSQRTLQSRVADNLFWLGRYLERSDWTMRAMRTSLGRRVEYLTSSENRDKGDVYLERLLGKTSAVRAAAGAGRIGSLRTIDLARRMMTDRESYYGLAPCFEGIYRVASLTRDRLSLEAWRTLAHFHVDEAWRKRMADATTSEILDEIENKLPLVATFTGHMHGSMTRNFGWMFLDMGRRIERATNLCDVLELLFVEPLSEDSDITNLGYVLRLADSYITYRSRYRLQPILPLVLDLLVTDETNPRSLAFQLAGIGQHLEALPKAGEGTTLSRERKILLGLHTAVRLADVYELSVVGGEGERGALQELLSKANKEMPELSEAISRHFFRLVDDQPHRALMRIERRT